MAAQRLEMDNLKVSQPQRTKGSKTVRAVITFEPRTSHFDTNNARTGQNEFRGFFTLFWISIFILTVQSYVTSFERNGYPLSLAFATLFSRNAFTLALSDGVLVASTGLSVLFVKAVQKGWIRYYYTGIVIHHTFQTLMLACAVTWTFNRKWYWVQSGFFTLHSLVMLMKVHSYCAVNGYLSWVARRADKLDKELHIAAEKASGSYESALAQATANKPPAPNSVNESTAASSVAGSPPHGTNGDVPSASALRHRLLNAHANGTANPSGRLEANQTPRLVAPDHAPAENAHEHPLAHHPDPNVAKMAKQMGEYEAELTSDGPDHVKWPANISFANFADYHLIPTLVYELEYPRTDRIRPLYVLEKTVATFGTFALLYTVTEHSIIPLIPSPGSDQPFWRSLLDLTLPFMMAYHLLFYIIFECICNGFAELSRFADRRFYDDWWNSTNQDEFARKWNRPVHSFLLRHVYASTMAEYKLSKHSATLITFLLSACVHELVMAIVTKKIRMYLFAMQMAQIPLIAIGRIPAIKRNKILGNIVFWLGLYAGFPLLCVAYCTY